MIPDFDISDDILEASGLGKPKPLSPVKRPRAKNPTEALQNAADELGVDAGDLGGIISFESAGSFNPHKVGGENNAYKGLIQFGPDEQKRYYDPKDTFVSLIILRIALRKSDVIQKVLL